MVCGLHRPSRKWACEVAWIRWCTSLSKTKMNLGGLDGVGTSRPSRKWACEVAWIRWCTSLSKTKMNLGGLDGVWTSRPSRKWSYEVAWIRWCTSPSKTKMNLGGLDGVWTSRPSRKWSCEVAWIRWCTSPSKSKMNPIDWMVCGLAYAHPPSRSRGICKYYGLWPTTSTTRSHTLSQTLAYPHYPWQDHQDRQWAAPTYRMLALKTDVKPKAHGRKASKIVITNVSRYDWYVTNVRWQSSINSIALIPSTRVQVTFHSLMPLFQSKGMHDLSLNQWFLHVVRTKETYDSRWGSMPPWIKRPNLHRKRYIKAYIVLNSYYVRVLTLDAIYLSVM